MGVAVVRYTTKPDRADENQALIEKVFAELDAERPAGLRYASFRLADAVSFVHVAEIDTDDGSNPLTADAGVRRVPPRHRRSLRGQPVAVRRDPRRLVPVPRRADPATAHDRGQGDSGVAVGARRRRAAARSTPRTATRSRTRPRSWCRSVRPNSGTDLRCLDDLHAMLVERGDWVPLGSADEQKPAAAGTVEAGRAPDDNPSAVGTG